MRRYQLPEGGFWDGPSDLSTRLRDVAEPNALLVRRRAADRLVQLEALVVAALDLPLWRLEDYDIPNDEFEAVTRFRAALIVATPGPESVERLNEGKGT